MGPIEIILIALAAVIIALVAVVIIRTIAFKPKKEEPVQICENIFDEELAVKSLQEMVKCKTVSYYDKDKEDYAEFEKLESKLEELFPLVHKNCNKQKLGPKSLLYCLKGESSEKVTVLMAHYDVVPVNEELWDKGAFDGIIENDVLWGRGTLDTKGTLNGVLNAAESLISQGFKPKQDIYFAFAGDEEVNGTGAPTIVKYFQDNNINVDFVIDEGGAVVDNIFPGIKDYVAVVGIAEKGMLNVKLEVNAAGGHASAPPAHCTIGKLAKAVIDIENHPYKFRLGEPAAKMFDTLGRRSTFVYRMIFANMWLFKGILNNMCKKKGGEMNALVRTTSAITQMEGSKAINVFPPQASVGINFRLISGETMDETLVRLNEIVDNDEISITKINGMNPSRISQTDYRWDQIKKAIEETWDNTIVSPYLMIACSDCRHYGVLSDHVYRFSAMKLSKEERSTIHGNNERIPLETIKKTVNFYINVMKNC